ncbi:hypothetical protein [Aggregatilinea lenta]|uniref:hypothetical protein n=1 Tax=Aggregatilinea lenta TaxID=913108 RepID=UPI000E5BB86F|nr:hypothetical protein [Aggregatilinea lenta]
MTSKLVRIGIRFGIAIAVILAFGGLFSVYASEVLSQERQDDVLIKAIPFVAVFVSILLVYIYSIVALAVVVSGRVPQRAYRPIEAIIIAGILLGIVALFQGWKMFAYEYGFLLLLFSTLAFIVWSHITPLSARAHVPPLPRRAHVIGLVAGAIVWIALAGALIVDARPVEPYGIGRQIWELMMDDEEQQATADQAESEYRTTRIPVFILISLLPAGLVYLAARELAGPSGAGPEADLVAPTGPAEVSDVTAP